jgi:hypothetical protein
MGNSAMIEKKGSKYILKAKSTGKLLGSHKTKEEALAQERAINISKAKKKK